MNQRGAVMAASIVSGLAIVIGVFVFPSLKGFVGAADESAECDLPEAISIDGKDGATLLNPNAPNVRMSQGQVTIPLDPTIVAGMYSVKLVSFDRHSISRPHLDQTGERWFVRLLDENDKVVYESPPTQDLEDEKNLRSDTFVRQPVAGTATQLQAVHHGEGTSINSIHAVCAVFIELPIDLIVTLDDAPRGEAPKEPIVTPGAPFDYVVNVLNLGPEGAHNVEAVLTMSDEVVVDIAALDPACVPAGTDEIECFIGPVPVGEISKVRVAVRVRGDSPGIGTLMSSVIVGDEGFPGERVEPNNRDVEPTTFPVANGIG